MHWRNDSRANTNGAGWIAHIPIQLSHSWAPSYHLPSGSLLFRGYCPVILIPVLATCTRSQFFTFVRRTSAAIADLFCALVNITTISLHGKKCTGILTYKLHNSFTNIEFLFTLKILQKLYNICYSTFVDNNQIQFSNDTYWRHLLTAFII